MPSRPYPPVIRARDWATGAPPGLAIEQPCGSPVCSLEDLAISENAQTLGGRSFHRRHSSVAAGDPGRFRLAPGEDQLFVSWRFEGAVHVRSVKLELFHQGTGGLVSIWTKEITWEAGRCPGVGSTPFSGRLERADIDLRATDTKDVTIDFTPDPQGDFPTGHLNVQRAPYKLEMTITQVDGAAVRTRARWIYVDVEVAGLSLELGPERIVKQHTAPGAQGDRRIGSDRRNRELHARMSAALGGEQSVANHDVNVPLDGNLFGAAEDEWTDNTAFQAWGERCGDGPYIPLVSRVTVRSFRGTPVPAPMALGGAVFLWDWEGPARDAPFDVRGVHTRSHTQLAAAYEVNAGQWPTGGWNTPEPVGGKRGRGAKLFLHDDEGHENYVDGGLGHFPFPMGPCDLREGAIASAVRTSGDFASCTGAIFTPSRIARDRFKLTVYFAYGDHALWDVASTAAELRDDLPYAVPSVTSGWFQVLRLVRIARWWRHNDSVSRGSFSWAMLAREFEGTGIVIDSASSSVPTNIPPERFREVFSAKLQQLDADDRSFFAPESEQAAPGQGFGLKLSREGARHKQDANDAAKRLLGLICGAIAAEDCQDEDGIQIFQFDFDDDHGGMSANGWAIQTPSNRTRCPECDAALLGMGRTIRACFGCQARLRSNAVIMTIAPLTLLAKFSLAAAANLPAHQVEYFMLSHMEGARPEIVVAHEIGHHLFLPHSPDGFSVPDPPPGGPFWLAFRGLLKTVPRLQATIEAKSTPEGAKAEFHATHHKGCIMGYNFAEMPNLHFCHKCTLRLRGWDGGHVELIE